MEIEKAREIVLLLANGTDPITGEVFPDDSPYNHPSVIRALFAVLGNVRIPKKQNKQSIEEKQAQMRWTPTVGQLETKNKLRTENGS